MRLLGVAIALGDDPGGFTEARSQRLGMLDERAKGDEKRDVNEDGKRRARLRRPFVIKAASGALQMRSDEFCGTYLQADMIIKSFTGCIRFNSVRAGKGLLSLLHRREHDRQEILIIKLRSEAEHSVWTATGRFRRRFASAELAPKGCSSTCMHSELDLRRVENNANDVTSSTAGYFLFLDLPSSSDSLGSVSVSL